VTLAVTSEFCGLSDRLCREAGFSPAVAFEADDVAAVRALVGAASASPSFPPCTSRPPAAPPRRWPSRPRTPPVPSGLAWIAGRQLPGLAEAFRGWLISFAPGAGDLHPLALIQVQEFSDGHDAGSAP
jgi:LysR family transcriptional regulator, transcription activator of glutamate synthase operon